MTGNVSRHRVWGVAVVALAMLVPTVARGQMILKVNDTTWFRVGMQMQAWGDWLQDQTGGYGQNLFLRRARFQLTGQFGPDVTFFFQTDSPNLGKTSATTTKGFSPGFLIQDAWFEWKLADEFAIDAGEMIIPTSRNELTSTLSFITLDISPTSTVFAGPTQTNGTRDTGFMAHGYLGGGHFEYRAGLFQGVRVTGARNSLLGAVYLQYDFLDTEKGYVFAGTNLGKRKILALSGGYETQNSYRAYSGDLFANIPVGAGDEVAGQIQWMHYDGQDFIKTIANQNDYLAELAYYIHGANTQPFVKYEDFKYVASTEQVNDKSQYGAGLNYYVHGQNLKLTGQYLHVQPKNPALKNTNEMTFQIQMFYN